MFRFVVSLAAVAFATLTVSAQPPALSELRIIDAKVEKGRLVWSETRYFPFTKDVEIEVEENGVKAVKKVSATDLVPVVETRGEGLKGLKATDERGKVIDAGKLAEMLKEPMPVVFALGAISDKHRALFKVKTVFIEILPQSSKPVLPTSAAPPIMLPPVPPPMVPPKK